MGVKSHRKLIVFFLLVPCVQIQAKGWRNQRNLYLTCLALSLWWTVYTVFVYKTQMNALLQKLESQSGGGQKAVGSGSSGSSAAKAVAKHTEGEHEVAEPVKKEGLAHRKAPKPSAPALD
jgi:hypothetical protein